jgi:hypothetical protein
MIFVFGSNEAGSHGAGAALYARRYCGAKTGVGFGPSGNSFAVPTKDRHIKTLPLAKVSAYAREFLEFIYRLAVGRGSFARDGETPRFLVSLHAFCLACDG